MPTCPRCNNSINNQPLGEEHFICANCRAIVKSVPPTYIVVDPITREMDIETGE